MPGTADADDRGKGQRILLGPGGKLLQHVDECHHSVVAFDVLVGVAPQLRFDDLCLAKVGCFLEVQLDDACPDIGAADVDGENAVVTLEHPRRQQMRGAYQAGLVGIRADQLEIDVDTLGLEQHGGPAHGQLSDPAAAEAAADDETLGVAPLLDAQKLLNDDGKLLGELLDGALDDAGCFRLALLQDVGKLGLADLVARLVAEGVLPKLFQWLSPFLEDVPERAFAGLVADEAVVVGKGEAIAVHRHAGQDGCAMGRKLDRLLWLAGRGLLAHDVIAFRQVGLPETSVD